MSIFKRIFRRSAADKSPNTQPPVLNPWLTTTPIFPVGDYFVFSQQGYLRNELVYRGLNMLAGAIAEAPIRVYSRDAEPIEPHPLRALIKRPNPFMGEHLLWETTVLYLYLSGNAFWVKVRSASGRVIEVWPLRPDRLRIIPDNVKFVAGYIYEIGGRQYPLDREDVVHFKFPHPVYDYWGLSPLQAALRRIVIDNETADFTKVLLQNNATPSIAVTTQNAIDQATADRLSVRWRERFGGRNRGGPAFLQAGMDIKTIGLSMKDLAFPELDASSQKRVLVALGVPPVLLGQEATFSNYEQARVSFYEDTVEPLQSRLDDRLESDLLYADYDNSDDLELKFDTSRVSALRPVRELRWKNAQAGVQGGWLTVNRALAMVGEQPEADGDVYLRPQNVLAVPARSGLRVPLDAAGNDTAQLSAPAGRALSDGPRPEPADGAAPNHHGRVLSKGAPHSLSLGAISTPCVTDGFFPQSSPALGAGETREGEQAVIYPPPARLGGSQPLLRRWARDEVSRQARDVMRALGIYRKALTRDQAAQIEADIAALLPRWQLRAARSAAPFVTELARGTGITREVAALTGYAAHLAECLCAHSATDLGAIVKEAERSARSVEELRRQLEAKIEQWNDIPADSAVMTRLRAIAVEVNQ
jgi:HK97 family phage portal protein